MRRVSATISMGSQLAEQAREIHEAFNEILAEIIAGKPSWDSSKVDWDAVEQMYEDGDY